MYIKPAQTEYRVCNRCVMDTSDPNITFDSDGFCSHCNEFYSVTKQKWFPNDEGRLLLEKILLDVKESGKDKTYDCILGLSGGVDSSYLALKIHELGLRPLVIHVDAGWNSELAVANIEAIVRYCHFDLHTHVVDWETMRDMHLAYLRSGVANQDVPQDHIFFSTLYHYATKNNIRYIISGGNWATESIFPVSWHGSAMDAINLRAIHKKHGTTKLSNYQTISFFQYYIWFPFVKKLRTIRPLNYMPYNKNEALEELVAKVGYKPYARKHGESIFTKLFQNYYLPVKFGYDKRKPHLSSLIVSNQITREGALSRLSDPLYDPEELAADIAYFCKKLRITHDEFMSLLNVPNRDYTDYANWDRRYKILKWFQRIILKTLGRDVRIYS